MRLHPTDDDPFAKSVAAGAVFGLVFYAGYLIGIHPPRDHLGYLIGHDFVNDWMGARAVLLHRLPQLLDFDAYQRLLQHLFPGLPPHNWSYPPHLLLFLWPLGYLPYLWAYALWVLCGLLALYAAAQVDRLERGGLLFLFAAPAVIICLVTGQNGFFTAALLIASLSLLDRRPLLAGMLIGLLSVKPQLGVLIPLALALSGRWRVFAAAAATVLLLFGLSCAAFGFDVWRDYVREVMPFQRLVLEQGGGLSLVMMPTAFVGARILGAPTVMAYLIQVPFTLAAVAATVWTFRRRRDPALSAAVLVTATFLATPYVFNYDMVVFAWLLWRLRPLVQGRVAIGLVLSIWWLPALCMVAGVAHLPVGAPMLAGLLVWLLARLRAEAAADVPQATELAAAGA